MRNFILDTDWWTDCDDIVALRLMCRLHKAGKICFKGVTANTCMEHTAASLSALLDSEKVDIPVGVTTMPVALNEGEILKYQVFMKDFPHSLENKDCPDSMKLMRKLLAQSEEKIEIVEIGFQHVLIQLLNSEPDEFSPLSGKELIAQKVEKLWVMAGKWDEPNGKEYNFCNCSQSREAGHILCKEWCTPITFLGFEVGHTVITGRQLPETDFLKQCMTAHGSPNGRNSWDPMTCYLAYVGDAEKAGYTEVFGTASLNPETGENNFVQDANGKHSYVIKRENDNYYRETIDKWIANDV